MKDAVIIIPTYNRQHYLKRVISYYSTFPNKVFICDSSSEKAEVESKDNISYLWTPHSNFYQKILDVINRTSSMFYALSPDDDFLKIETLTECIEKLESNNEFSIGTGGQIFFDEGFHNGFYKYEVSNQLQGINEIAFGSKYDYVKYFWEHYQNIHWSVFRKEVIMSAFQALERCNYENGNFVEMTLGIEALKKGKVYISTNPLNFREIMINDHWGTIAPPLSYKNIRNILSLREDVNKFKRLYSDDSLFPETCLYMSLNAHESKSIVQSIKEYMPNGLKRIIKKLFSIKFLGNRVTYIDEVMDKRIKMALAQ